MKPCINCKHCIITFGPDLMSRRTHICALASTLTPDPVTGDIVVHGAARAGDVRARGTCSLAGTQFVSRGFWRPNTYVRWDNVVSFVDYPDNTGMSADEVPGR